MIRNNKEIDLEHSFVFFNQDKENTWRSNIKSVLINESENKTYYLTKECRAENIGHKKFLNTGGYEFLAIVSNINEFTIIRTYSVNISGPGATKEIKYQNISKNRKNKILLNYKKIKILHFTELNKLLKLLTDKNVFCKIEYTFKNQNYSIISKCEYINFDGSLSINRNLEQDYVQVVMGYIPFELKNKIYPSYFNKYISKNLDGNLEILLREETNLYNIKSRNFLIKTLKFLLNKTLFFIKKNEFSHYISIKNSKILFYTYEN